MTLLLSNTIDSKAIEVGSISTNQPTSSPTIAIMLLTKVGKDRILKEKFNYTTAFEVKKIPLLNTSILPSKDYRHKILSFRISYDPDQKTGPSEEIITFGDKSMFEKLLQGLYPREGEEMRALPSPPKKRRLSDDFSNIDYFRAATAEVQALMENEAQLPPFFIDLLIESGIDKEKLAAGFKDSIEYRAKKLKRKREEKEEAATLQPYKLDNYISYLAELDEFKSQCAVLVNGDEGVFSMELTLQTLDKEIEASSLPLSLPEFYGKLKNWTIGKIITLYNKKVALMRQVAKPHPTIYN